MPHTRTERKTHTHTHTHTHMAHQGASQLSLVLHRTHHPPRTILAVGFGRIVSYDFPEKMCEDVVRTIGTHLQSCLLYTSDAADD